MFECSLKSFGNIDIQNSHPDITAERCFASSVDLSKTVRKSRLATRFHLFDCSLSLV